MIRQDSDALPSPDPANTPLLTALVVAVFALTLPVGFAWGLGFAAIVALAGLFCVPALRYARPPNRLTWLLIAIVLWAMLSMLWSRAGVDPHGLRRYGDVAKLTSAKLVLQLALYGAFIAGARRLNPRNASLALMVLAAAITALSVVVLLDAVLSARVYMWFSVHVDRAVRPDLARRNISTGLYVVVVLFWCAAVRLIRARRRLPVAVTAICVVAASLVLHEADATLAAFALGALAFIAVRAWGAVAAKVLAAVATVYWLGAPFVIIAAERLGLIPAVRPFIGPSWDRRLDIWIFSAVRVTEKPWFGWGLDASRTFDGGIALHPHDGAMQVWLELGLVGAALFAALSLWIWWLIDRIAVRARTVGAALAATLVAYLTIGGVSFGIWQEWWLAIAALGAAAGLCLIRGIPARP